jgi:peptidoglycan/LPS O-acetylase OafA/YrhL
MTTHVSPRLLSTTIKISSVTISSNNRFESLDGLRAIACFLVLVAHFGLGIEYTSPTITAIRAFFPGELDVMTFFCLSSFLITLLLIREHNKTGRIKILKFVIKRALRIWPLYFFLVFFTLFYSQLVLPMQHVIKLTECWKYLIFIAN